MRSRILSAMLALTGTLAPPVTAAAEPAGRADWFTTARLGGFIHWSAGGVFGARWFGSNPLPHPWETAATLNRSWGCNRDDDQWKSTGFLLRMAAHNISLGGNLTINIGPDATPTPPTSAWPPTSDPPPASTLIERRYNPSL